MLFQIGPCTKVALKRSLDTLPMVLADENWMAPVTGVARRD
jgi:hypothetical protein